MESPKPATRRASSEKIDLKNALVDPNYNVSFKTKETDDEIKSRLKIEEQKASWEIFKNKVLLIVFVILVSIAVGSCVRVVLGPTKIGTEGTGYTPDEKKLAMGLIGSIVSAGLGFIAGKQQAK